MEDAEDVSDEIMQPMSEAAELDAPCRVRDCGGDA